MRTNILKQLTGFMIVSALVFSGCEAGLTSNDSGGEFSFSEIYTRVDSLQKKVILLEQTNLDQKTVIENMEQNALTFMTDIQTTINLMAPVGSIIAWHKNFGSGAVIPVGWVECDGRTINDSESIYNGENVPDLNSSGMFLRGGTNSGTFQDDATAVNGLYMNSTGSHSHGFSYDSVRYNGRDAGSMNTGAAGRSHAYTGITDSAGNHVHTMYSSDTETRPINMSVVWIMRIK